MNRGEGKDWGERKEGEGKDVEGMGGREVDGKDRERRKKIGMLAKQMKKQEKERDEGGTVNWKIRMNERENSRKNVNLEDKVIKPRLF